MVYLFTGLAAGGCGQPGASGVGGDGCRGHRSEICRSGISRSLGNSCFCHRAGVAGLDCQHAGSAFFKYPPINIFTDWRRFAFRSTRYCLVLAIGSRTGHTALHGLGNSARNRWCKTGRSEPVGYQPAVSSGGLGGKTGILLPLGELSTDHALLHGRIRHQRLPQLRGPVHFIE